MGQIASITINNGATTPVAVTFAPLPQANGVVSFVDRTSNILEAMARINVSYSEPSNTRKTTKTRFTFELPVLETVAGVPTVTRVHRADVNFIFAPMATDGERKDIYAYVYNGLNHALVKAAMRDNDPMY